MATARNILKTYFETGKKPNQQEFAELIDAFVHVDDNLSNVLGVLASISEAQQGVANDKYMSPLLTKVAIDYQIKDGIVAARNTLNKLNTILQNQIDSHNNDTNNPHSVTKSQVGLSNIPNSKTDVWNDNSSNKLATSKCVFNAYNEVEIIKLNIRIQTQNTGAGAGILSVSKTKELAQNTTVTLVNSTTLRITHNLGTPYYDIFGINSNHSSLNGLGTYTNLLVLSKQSNYVDVKVSNTFSIVSFVLKDFGIIGGGSLI